MGPAAAAAAHTLVLEVLARVERLRMVAAAVAELDAGQTVAPHTMDAPAELEVRMVAVVAAGLSARRALAVPAVHMEEPAGNMVWPEVME